MRVFIALLATAICVIGATTVIRGPISIISGGVGGGGGGGDPTFTEFVTNSATSATGQSHFLTNNFSAGDTFVVGITWEDATATPTVTNSVGTLAMYTNSSNSGVVFAALFVEVNCSAGTSVRTGIDMGASKNSVTVCAWRIAGASASAPVDKLAEGNSASSGGGGTGPVTTTQANTVGCYMALNFGGLASTPQASWTEDRDANASEWQHIKYTSTGTYRGTNDWSGNDAYASCAVWIK